MAWPTAKTVTAMARSITGADAGALVVPVAVRAVVVAAVVRLVVLEVRPPGKARRSVLLVAPAVASFFTIVFKDAGNSRHLSLTP
jgi:hypothetical protein